MFLKVDVLNKEPSSVWKEGSWPGRDAAAGPLGREPAKRVAWASSPQHLLGPCSVSWPVPSCHWHRLPPNLLESLASVFLNLLSFPHRVRREGKRDHLSLDWASELGCQDIPVAPWTFWNEGGCQLALSPIMNHQKFGLVQWEKKKPTKNCVQVSIICGRLKGLSGSRDSTWWNVCILGLSWTVWVTAGVGQKDQTAGTRRRGRSTEGVGIASCALHGGPGQHRGQPVPVRLPEDRATPGPVSHHGWHFSVAADCVCLHTEYVHPEVTGRVSQGRPGWMALWHWLLQVLLPKTASPALEMLPRPGVNQPSFPTSRNELSFYHLTDGEPTFSLIMVRYSRVPEKGT